MTAEENETIQGSEKTKLFKLQNLLTQKMRTITNMIIIIMDENETEQLVLEALEASSSIQLSGTKTMHYCMMEGTIQF